MDDLRFDNLTRTLARSTSRRGLLTGVLAGLASGIGGARGARSVAAARAPRQAAGVPCARATDCASFSCVDGVCCDSACTGQCESCATGACQPVAGAPVGQRPACPGDGPCAATCDGVTTSHCAAAPGAEVACGSAACADGWQTTFACAGNGACVPTTTNCAPYGCAADGASCATGCTSHEQCPGAAYCSADGRCLGDQPLGASCGDGAACLHGHCVHGVCCNESCDGACRACDLPGNEGFCTEIPDGGGCAGGACCDGACVDRQSDLAHCGACDHACPRLVCHDAVCAGGVCGAQPQPDETRCDDGDACTQTDACHDGVCVGGDPVVCQPLDQCHVAGVCDSATGGCSNPNKPDDVSCNDGNACTEGDTCQAGVCTSGTPLACTTDNPCLIASCDPDRGCVDTPKGEGITCADDDKCDGNEACDGAGNCVAGTPVTCGECTVCDAASGQCLPANDNDPCTPPPSASKCLTGWVCDGGQCLHQYVTICLAEDECHTAGQCDPATGLCSSVDVLDDTHCGIDDMCVSGRTCQAGVCTGGYYRDPCGLSLDFCGTGGHCDPWTGACVDREPVNEGSECTNIIADACTVAQQCQGGVCTNIYEEGSPCSGGFTDACTVEQKCLSGVCTNVQKDCSGGFDPYTCYAGVCNPDTGTCHSTPKPPFSICTFVNECGGNEDGRCGLDAICRQATVCPETDDPCLAYNTCEVRDDGTVSRCGKSVYWQEEQEHICSSDGKICRDDGSGTGKTECGCGGELCEPHEICCRGQDGPYCFPRLGTPLCPF